MTDRKDVISWSVLHQYCEQLQAIPMYVRASELRHHSQPLAFRTAVLVTVPEHTL
jgi:hypothetical protein